MVKSLLARTNKLLKTALYLRPSPAASVRTTPYEVRNRPPIAGQRYSASSVYLLIYGTNATVIGSEAAPEGQPFVRLSGHCWLLLAGVDNARRNRRFTGARRRPARRYLEADRSRADDYYLTEGTGIADRYVASPTEGVSHAGPLSGDAYEAWVAGCDPVTGTPKGRLRSDENAVRFVEVTINGPKSWSLAAAIHGDISAAYDVAQARAAEQIIGWLAQHATTRIGPRGGQVQVPVAELEAVTVRHYTSRAGDPHRHLHLQVNARVRAEDRWFGLHTVGVRDSLDAVNGIGHAAMMTDPAFRAGSRVARLHPRGERRDHADARVRGRVQRPHAADRNQPGPLRSRLEAGEPRAGTRPPPAVEVGPLGVERRPTGQDRPPRWGRDHRALGRRTARVGLPRPGRPGPRHEYPRRCSSTATAPSRLS